MAKLKYKVVSLSVSGKGNNIYRNGTIVEGSKLNNLDFLISDGAIVLDGKEEKEEKTLDEMNVKELTAFYVSLEPSAEELKDFEGIKKDEKVAFLKSL